MAAFWESAFEFLFKYRPLVFEKGRLVLATPWPVYVFAILGGILLGLTLLAYRRASARNRRDAAVLAALRIAALAVLLFCIARPTLLVPTVIPQRNFLGVLIDDSRSMTIADRNDRPRGEFAHTAFGAPDSVLRAVLEERFMLRFFRFSETTERLDDLSQLSTSGNRTDLAQALDAARRDLSAVPLAGLIVLTDGADNSESPLTESLLALRASSVPVYSVGLGRERFARDVELSRVETPRSVLRGSSLVVDLLVSQTGYRGKTVRVDVEDEGRIVSSQDVRLPEDGESATVRDQFSANVPGPRIFRFRVAPQAGEQVTENNQREALIVVEDSREKILYFEGELRFEVKFVRRAIADDPNVRVVTLQRTGQNKFLRMDVEDAEELASGFPKTREELFAYKGLILGSVEASFFTHDQLQMIEEFVGQRGGGLLALGGLHSFSRGAYAGTPVADVLPVVLPETPAEAESFHALLTIEPTRFGLSHPVTQIGAGASGAAAAWSQLPQVTSVNPIRSVKSGASTLLVGRADDQKDPLIVLAYQRYGRGKALALPIQDSWLWQMVPPLDDMSHEKFWQQLLRWLVSYVPDRVTASASRDQVGQGEPLTINAEVQDETFLRLNNAEVIAHITTPSGLEQQAGMNWAVESDGEYRSEYVPSERGLHRVRVEARKDGELVGEQEVFFEARELATEFYDAEMRAGLLQRVAEETGGRFYTPETVMTLPEDVSLTESGTTVVEERDLWDMPLLFFILVGLIGTEWLYRRRRGLV